MSAPVSDSFPFHEEFQATIVAYLWRHPGALQKYIDVLPLAYLKSGDDSAFLGLLYRYYKEHKKVPSKSVILELIRTAYPDSDSNTLHKKSQENLNKKLGVFQAADISDRTFIEEKIKDFVQFEALKLFASETVQNLKTKKYDPELPKKARIALEAGRMLDDDLGHEWGRQTITRVGNATNPDFEPRIPTGVHHLDSLIGGGLKAGELGILLGLPKGFKSGTMLNFAFSALKATQGQHVAYITLELSEELVGLRFDFRTANLPKSVLLQDQDRFLKVLQTRQDIIMGKSRLFIKRFPTKACTVDTVRSYLDKLQDYIGGPIGMLIVDYMDLMKASKKREKSYQEDVDICEDLRDVANEYRFPIWTACRATREAVGKKRISMAHMSRAFERVGVADLMIALCQTEREKAAKIMRLYLAAARNDEGEKMVNCKIDYERMLIKSEGISDPEYEDGVDGGGEDGQRRGRRGGRPQDWDAPPPQRAAA